MPPVQSTPGEQHVVSRALWVREVSLLQNYHSKADMPVNKMYPHHRPHRQSSRTTLDRAILWSSSCQEGYPVCLRFLTRCRGCPTLLSLRRLPMLRPHVPCHQPKLHLLYALLTLQPSLLLLPVRRALYRHPSPLFHLQLIPCRLSWAADQVNCLTNIGLQACPIEQADKGAK